MLILGLIALALLAIGLGTYQQVIARLKRKSADAAAFDRRMHTFVEREAA